MSENTQPEQNPLNIDKPGEVPPGYDQPAPPAYGAPSYQEPAAPQPPSYQQPEPQAAPYPGAPQANQYQANQQASPYQNNQQPYQQQGYAQPNMQQGYQQGGYGVGEQKSKVVAGVLGILLGTLGIHNFYLGKTKIALIQLLVSVISFGTLAWAIGIWGLVEGILILVGHENYRTDGKGIPLKD